MPSEFDAIAQSYDTTFSRTAVGALLREHVWSALSPLLAKQNSSPKYALELNCGTGEDAVWLAKKGWNVLATDISAEMISVAQAKAAQAGQPEFNPEALRFQVCSLTNIGQLKEQGFDLVFSNFGGLNCVSPAALKQLGPTLARKIKPDGIFVAVVMSRFCWWETLYFMLKMKPGAAFRRFSKKPVAAKLDAQTSVPTWYYTPSELKHLLLPYSAQYQVSARPIGIWLPPSYLNPFFEKHPRLLGALHFLENHFAPSWLAGTADHFLICISPNRR